MTHGEKKRLEREGGCKACGQLHPLRLCQHPNARAISQQFHEARLADKSAKRSREASGITAKRQTTRTTSASSASSTATVVSNSG